MGLSEAAYPVTGNIEIPINLYCFEIFIAIPSSARYLSPATNPHLTNRSGAGRQTPPKADARKVVLA